MARYMGKKVERTMSIGDAVSDAFGEIESLAEEVREVVDNANDAAAATQRMQTLDETASLLEDNIDMPDVPEALSDVVLNVVTFDKGRKASRASRRDNAVSILDAVVQHVQELLDDETAYMDEREELEEFIEALEDTKDEWDSAEFPGMMG